MNAFSATLRKHAHHARKQDRCHQRACKRSSHMHMGDTLRCVQDFCFKDGQERNGI